MTVRQLILELKELDPDLEVYFDTESDFRYDIAEWVSEEDILIYGGSKNKVALIKNEWPD